MNTNPVMHNPQEQSFQTVTPQPLSPSEERTWAILAHLSVLVNLFTGILGPVIALVIYLVFKDRSRYVGFQALQSFILQLITWVGAGIIVGAVWAITGILSIVLVGILLIPIATVISVIFGLLPVVAIVYAIVAAIECNNGVNFRYWLISDWVQKP